MSVRSQFIAVVLAAGVLATGLSAGARPHMPQAIKGDWTVSEVAGTAVPEGIEVSMRFDAEGRLSGRGGCNRYAGSYEASAQRLDIGALAMTRMACPDDRMVVETRFAEAMARVARAGLDDAGALILTDDAGATVIVAQPAAD